MCLKTKEQLHEALVELKQSQEREGRLMAENRAILDAISSITSASNKQQIFQELKNVLSLYIDFSDFIVLSKKNCELHFNTLLTSNKEFEGVEWCNDGKFPRVLEGDCILLFEPAKLKEFACLDDQQKNTMKCALATGVKATITDSIILLIGNKVGQFTLDSRETLSRFRPLLERALIDIEHKEQLQHLVDVRTQQLKLAQIKAEKANEAKSRFLAMMSHELRTPLNAVLGYIDVLLDDLSIPEQLEMLEKMESSAELLLVLINDILDLSRIESGEFSTKYQWVKLRGDLSSILEHFQTLANAKGLDFAVDLEFDQDLLLWIDPTRVMQIVFNLVGNALKFTEQGSVSLSATISNSVLKIEVKDTGIGIERSRLNAIFSQFRQADDSITRKYGGSGLGLTISKHLAELMSGSISVESAFGKGSVFTINLPVRTKLSAHLDEHPHDLAINFGKSLNILVVEDTVTNQMVIKLILEKLGHKVVTQNNGLEAVDYFKRNSEHIDLIFMDISMPVMDGLTATKQIRQFCNVTPIIALTAHAMAKDKQTCIDAGMNAFVSKPIRSKEIQRTLKAVINV